MRKFSLIVLIIFLFFLSSCDEKDVFNEVPGKPGKDGTSLLVDNGNPSSNLGNIGDSYIDIKSWDYYVKVIDGWILVGNIKGSVESDYIGTEGLKFYPINETECAVSVGNARYLKEIVIPSKYKNYTVTTIDSGMGQYDTGFSQCFNLKKITLPNTITTIEENAFASCPNLKEITIPDSVTYIGSEAFANCVSLDFNEFDNGYYLGNLNNPYLVFIRAKDSYIKTCVINENTKIIYSYAFAFCRDLKQIDIPKGVISIADHVFADCISLEKIIIPEGVESINYGTFFNCKSLKSIDIPNSVTAIGTSAFSQCVELITIVISIKVTTISDSTFSNCENLTIFCEAESKPDDWNLFWNRDEPVYWAEEWEYDENGNPVPIS
jgi:hypothetical protein